MRGRFGLVLGLLLSSAAFAAPPPGVTVAKPWMRYLLPSIPAGGYVTLQNSSDTPAVLTGASSPACGMLMLHQTQDMSGMAMMMDVPSVTVPAHGSVSFSPGGYHLMCMQPVMKPGTTVQVTLKFQDGSALAVAMPVFGATGAP
jgi:copper(I)-binding protein